MGDGLKQSKTGESSVAHPSHHLVLQLSSRLGKIQQLLESMLRIVILPEGKWQIDFGVIMCKEI